MHTDTHMYSAEQAGLCVENNYGRGGAAGTLWGSEGCTLILHCPQNFWWCKAQILCSTRCVKVDLKWMSSHWMRAGSALCKPESASCMNRHYQKKAEEQSHGWNTQHCFFLHFKNLVLFLGFYQGKFSYSFTTIYYFRSILSQNVCASGPPILIEPRGNTAVPIYTSWLRKQLNSFFRSSLFLMVHWIAS